MNSTFTYCRRLAWLWLSFCFSGAYLLADLASDTEQWQKDFGVWTTKVDQCRSRLKRSEEGTKQLSALDHDLEVMKTCVDRLPALLGELKTEDTRLRELKMLDLEPKQREVEQIRQSTEARLSQLLYEKQALQTAINQHNNKPHIFSDMQLGERTNYVAETAELKARWQRLTEAIALIRAETQPRYDNASRAVAKAQQDLNEAAAMRDRTAQLYREQANQYAFTRSFLVEQLVKMDHEAAPATASP